MCGESKPLTSEHFYAHGLQADGSARYRRTCTACYNQRRRERDASPEGQAKARARWRKDSRRRRRDAEKAEAMRAAARRWKAKAKADPEWRAAERERVNRRRAVQREQQAPSYLANLEYKRQWHRFKREQNPETVEPIRGKDRDQRVDCREFPRLPTAPLAAALDRHLHRLAVSAFDQGGPCMIRGEDGKVRPISGARRDGGAGSVTEVLCERLGISDKTLRDWRSGARPSVQFDVADRIVTRLGWLWWDVWQEGGLGHEAAARAFEGEEPEPLPIAKPRGRPFGQRAA